jgi:hypothetical protein
MGDTDFSFRSADLIDRNGFNKESTNNIANNKESSTKVEEKKSWHKLLTSDFEKKKKINKILIRNFLC